MAAPRGRVSIAAPLTGAVISWGMGWNTMNETVETSAGEARGEETGPVVLQVLPGLGNGGVARGTVDVAIAVAEAGGTPIVVSEGGAKERDLARAEIQPLTLPLAAAIAIATSTVPRATPPLPWP